MRRIKRRNPDKPSLEDEIPIWHFIYDNMCVSNVYEEVGIPLFTQYLEENNTTFTAEQLLEYYENTMQHTLYECDLEAEKILNLYKTLEIEISPHVKIMLESRFKAIVRLDSDRILVKFSIFSREPADLLSTKLSSKIPNMNFEKTPNEKESVHQNPRTSIEESEQSKDLPVRMPENPPKRAKRLPSDFMIAESFEESMWTYLYHNTGRLNSDLILSDKFWNDFLETMPDTSTRLVQVISQHFQENMLKNLYKQAMDPDTKIMLCKDLKIPMREFHRQWFRNKDGFNVTLTADGFVKDWKPVSEHENRSPFNSRILTWNPRMREEEDESRYDRLGPSTSSAIYRPRSPVSPVSDRKILPQSTSMCARTSCEPQPLEYRGSSANIVIRSKAEETKQRSRFTLDEQISACYDIYKKIKHAEENHLPQVLPKGLAFWNEFVRKNKTRKTAVNWNSHFRKIMCPSLHEMPLRREILLYLFKNIDIEVDDRVRNILEKKCNAKICIGVGRRVTSWIYLDKKIKEEPEEIAEKQPDIDEVQQVLDSSGSSPAELEISIDVNKDDTNDTTLPIYDSHDEDDIAIESEKDSTETAEISVVFKPKTTQVIPQEESKKENSPINPNDSDKNLKKTTITYLRSPKSDDNAEKAAKKSEICTIFKRNSSRNSSIVHERMETEENHEIVEVSPRRSVRIAKLQERSPKMSKIPRKPVRNLSKIEEKLQSSAKCDEHQSENGEKRNKATENPQTFAKTLKKNPIYYSTSQGNDEMLINSIRNIEKSFHFSSPSKNNESVPGIPTTLLKTATRTGIKSTEESENMNAFNPNSSFENTECQHLNVVFNHPKTPESALPISSEVVQVERDSYSKPVSKKDIVLDLTRTNKHLELLRSIQKVFNNDKNVSAPSINQAVLHAFRKDDIWDEMSSDITLASTRISAIINSNSTGNLRLSLLKNKKDLMDVSILKAENREVFHKRLDNILKVLNKELKKSNGPALCDAAEI